jgi:predicted secreted Zn-dependent protease
MKERTYPVVGCSPAELVAAMSLLGPTRGGHRYAAYTDWVVTYRFRVVDLAPAAVAVEADVTMTLPHWIPLRSVPRELVDRWERYVDALRAHERGHVALAERAVEEVRAAIAKTPRQLDIGAVHATAASAAEAALAAVRERERDYDVETRHGASQGASFP